MKNPVLLFLFVLTVVVFSQAHADTIKLDNVPLSNVVRLYFAEINKDAYSLPDELIKDDRKISLSISGNSEKLRKNLTDILVGYGYSITHDNGLYTVKKIGGSSPSFEEMEVFVYRPKSRTSQYLTDVLRNLYPSITQAAPGLHAPVPATGEYSSTSATAQLDNKSDRLIMKGTPGQIRDMKRLLVSLDVATPSIELQVYLIEHVKTKGGQSGFQALVAKLGSLSLNVGGVVAGDVLRFSSGAISLALSALKTDNAFSIYTSPRMLLVDRKKSRLVVGQDVPILGSTTDTQNGVTQSIEYRSSGVIMEATANILDDVIEVDSSIEVSSFATTTTGVTTSPTLTKRSIDTSTVLSDGVSVLYGGLTSAGDSEGSTGLSFLPKIMRVNSNTSDESELFVLMTAKRI